MRRMQNRLVLCLGIVTVGAVGAFSLLENLRSANLADPQTQVPEPAEVPEPLLQTYLLEPAPGEWRVLEENIVHRYIVQLRSGDLLRAKAEQRGGIDVVVKIVGPDGKVVYEVDSTDKVEEIFFIARAEGSHGLEVHRTEGPGSYRLYRDPIRKAGIVDWTRAEAEEKFHQGRVLANSNEPESMDAAVRPLSDAANLWENLGQRKRQADTFRRLGEIHSKKGHYSQALVFQDKALALFRELGDRKREILLLNASGVSHKELGNLNQAEDRSRRALDIAREVGDLEGEVDALNSLARLGEQRGEVWAALGYLDRALEIEVDPRARARLINNKGFIYQSLGSLERAIDFHKKALELLGEEGDRVTTASAIMGIAMAYLHLRRVGDALLPLAAALTLWREEGDELQQANTLATLGWVHLQQNNFLQAQRNLEDALRLYSKTENQRALATVWLNLGALALKQEQAHRAFGYYSQALPIAHEAGYSEAEATILLGMAKASRMRGNSIEARAFVEGALTLVENLRKEMGKRNLQIDFTASRQAYFEFYIDLLMDGPEADAQLALQVSERSRARGLLDSITEREVSGHAAPEGLQGRKVEIENALNQKEAERLALRQRGLATEEIEAEIRDLLDIRQTLSAKIRRSDPRYVARAQPKPLSLQEIQKELDEQTVLLEYFLGEERSFLWVVTPRSLQTVELPAREKLERVAGAIRDGLSSGPSGKRSENVQARLAEASDLLLKPAGRAIAGKRLAIVAHGALQLIPFNALPEPVFGAPDGEAPPLIRRRETVTIPSVSVLAEIRRQEDHVPASELLFLLADPVFHREDERLSRMGTSNQTQRRWFEGRLSRLWHSGQEAEAIQELARQEDVLVLDGLKANHEQLLSSDLGRFRYLHFATHGDLGGQPDLPGLALSAFDMEGKELKDQFLRVHEIENLELNADLVVLSACKTALGKDVKGEGLMGLPHAFLYAGADRVVVSLWNVHDEATSELMRVFYQGLLVNQLPPSRALREAQDWMSRQPQWRDPFYWAGFVLQGDWR